VVATTTTTTVQARVERGLARKRRDTARRKRRSHPADAITMAMTARAKMKGEAMAAIERGLAVEAEVAAEAPIDTTAESTTGGTRIVAAILKVRTTTHTIDGDMDVTVDMIDTRMINDIDTVTRRTIKDTTVVIIDRMKDPAAVTMSTDSEMNVMARIIEHPMNHKSRNKGDMVSRELHLLAFIPVIWARTASCCVKNEKIATGSAAKIPNCDIPASDLQKKNGSGPCKKCKRMPAREKNT
jgi:hypothetical protein